MRPVKITDENVQDIIDTAAYGGITYWAGQPTDEDFQNLPEGKEYTIREEGDYPEDAEVHYLSKADIRKAYRELLSLDQQYVNKTIHGYIIDSYRDRDENGIDCGHIDADAADVIVQVACFGEVRYG
ncbi:hypothetical protein SEA_YOSIF_73 [Streptomyces phage Yosif]|uniref:Uncharacterized protein n=1 Tax=Streptomyces phage Yosif TaxID=2201421 RepID=A0A2Z4QBZ3_9CAUD|nr:hypothetical protein KGG71_gp73 [Streptomyces phage Yosif]AWY07637.1 hypothetical protein SEA_YOSIF_73 [Streptomyces phage Yosif]